MHQRFSDTQAKLRKCIFLNVINLELTSTAFHLGFNVSFCRLASIFRDDMAFFKRLIRNIFFRKPKFLDWSLKTVLVWQLDSIKMVREWRDSSTGGLALWRSVLLLLHLNLEILDQGFSGLRMMTQS